jgi:hypothetical protein
MPPFVTLPLSQCHQTRGMALFGGCMKFSASGDGAAWDGTTAGADCASIGEASVRADASHKA